MLEIHKIDPSAETLKTIEEVVSKPKEVVEAPSLAASRQASGLAGSRQTSSSSLGTGRRDSAQFTAVCTASFLLANLTMCRAVGQMHRAVCCPSSAGKRLDLLMLH